MAIEKGYFARRFEIAHAAVDNALAVIVAGGDGGARSMDRTKDLFGPYQAQGVFVMRQLKLDARTAEMTSTERMTPGHGLAKDCAFDMPGFRNVLALRAEIERQWGGQVPSADRFVDLSAYQRARGHARP
jgi:hypothetical protein